jgi:hypothetical protein
MKRLLQNARPASLFGLCMLLTAAPAWAQSSPFVGKWRWNGGLSKLPPGETKPADLIADIARADALHVRWAVTVTNAQGLPAMKSFDIPANGEFYPISGDTTASFRLAGPSLQATFNGPAGEVDTLSCTVTGDVKTMTCNGEVREEDGKANSYVDVYDRIG